MITPEEVIKAAREELGDARVSKIIYVNEMASGRLADCNNTDLSRQFTSGTMPGDQRSFPNRSH